MALPTLYLDECVDVDLADGGREFAATITTALACGTLGFIDEEHLSYASERGWIIVTHNTRHFRRLHIQRHHTGIICMPEQSYAIRRLRLAMIIAWIRPNDIHANRLYTWGALQTLLTQGFVLPGFSADDLRLALGQR